jgi:uncharacterized glyoxalase superfamily protein PhnB/uncharacterized protein YndB with AHSA1/START domain
METKEKLQIKKDLPNKQLIVTRYFEAPTDLVWKAWTEKEYLNIWWAPEPFQVETKHFDFKEGGNWHYAMVSPENEKHWCRADILKVNKERSFEWHDCFCDDKGKINESFPRTHWHVEFLSIGAETKVVCTLTYKSEADLKQIMEMGMEQGFTMTLTALDRYLKEGFKLRKANRPYTTPRVVTYLNFPGTTEQAFMFYKKVFGTEFIGKGLQRFGEIPADGNNPPVPDNVKQMILHVELPILAGHILMGTDAPKEMGFELVQGGNMHICLEPTTRAETERIFKDLSEGGTVTMPLADMFFGAYFGEFKDKFGINWMLINYEGK